MRVGSRRGGFTLIEAVISLAIIAMMMAALSAASAFLIRTTPAGDSASARAAQINSGFDLFHEDVTLAVGAEPRGATMLAIFLADQDGDGVDETVIYEWDGDALLRTVNSSDPLPIASGLGECAFEYTIRSLPNAGMPDDATPSEMFDYVPSRSYTDLDLSDLVNFAQPIEFDLSAEAASCVIESVSVLMRRGSGSPTTGELYVHIYEDGGTGVPTGEPLASASVDPRRVRASGSFIEFRFDDLPVLSAGGAYTLLFENTSEATVTMSAAMPAASEPRGLVYSDMIGSWLALPWTFRMTADGRWTDQIVALEGLAGLRLEAATDDGRTYRFAASPVSLAPIHE